jgi:hypothetical protein
MQERVGCVAIEGTCRLLSVALLRVIEVQLNLDWDLAILLSKRQAQRVLLPFHCWERLLCKDGLCVVSSPALIGVVLVHVTVDLL